MTETDKKLLVDFDSGMLPISKFLNDFSINLKFDDYFIYSEIEEAIKSKVSEVLQITIPLIWFSEDIPFFINQLNRLLLNPTHFSHQKIAKLMQDFAPSSTSIPFIRKALETNFDYLQHTCSDSGTIAKWFSWLLYSIKTKDAIDLMKVFSNSDDEGIAKEMQYRLSKIQYPI